MNFATEKYSFPSGINQIYVFSSITEYNPNFINPYLMNKLIRLKISISFLLLVTLFGCTNPEVKVETNPAFGKYIFGYTSGVISKNDPIRIKLAKPYDGKFNTTSSLPDNLFAFEPSIEGEVLWEDNSTLKFIPKQPLAPGQIYIGKLNLNTLLPNIEDALTTFKFQFQTIASDMSVYIDGLEIVNGDLTDMVLKGKIYTADNTPLVQIEAALSAHQNEKDLPIEIVSVGNRTFNFKVSNIVRGEERSKVILKWSLPTSGEPLSGHHEVDVPSLSDFEVTNVQIEQTPEQVVTVYFSDPISEGNLNGLVSIEGVDEVKTNLSGNVLKIYPQKKITGSKLLRIDGNIKNIAGKIMGTAYTETLAFEMEKPALRILSEKAIIPTQKDQLLFPFEAVSLSGVDVYITKIFTNNILQYLQTADFGSPNYMNRVGRHIYRKHLNLRHSNGADPNKWNRYYVDLSEVINADPGALYEIDIRFKQEDAMYACDTIDVEESDNLTTGDQGWISDGTYFVDDYWAGYRYNWDERDNPCNAAYYGRSNTRVRKVVLASNIGVMAKMGGDNILNIVVNNLKTTKPIDGANVIVYDFQQQVIAKARTTQEGFAKIECKREPFIVLVTTADSRTYLKVDAGSALPLSKFDVSGAYVQKGVKGYIYGERGVWRPGDSLYLNFILEDAEDLIPENHPVEMQLFNPKGQKVERIVKTESVNNFYDFRTATTPNAPTGNYRMTVAIGNRTFSKNLKIETVKPNRLKIGFEFEKPKPGANDLHGTLTAKWLHGATASNLKASVDMSLQSTKTTFKSFEDYHFDNHLSGKFASNETRIFDGNLDANGQTKITVDMTDKTKNAPGMLKASFSTKVYEPGGNFSVDYYSIDYAPYKSFAGIRLPESKMWGNALAVDRPQHIDLVSVNSEGKVTNRKELIVKVYKIDRYWWYDRYNGSNYNYLNSKYYHEIRTDTVSLKNGKGVFDMTVDKANWGRYYIRVEDPVSGHTAAKIIYFDWPYWMRANRTESEASTILGFSSDKKSYQVGDSVKLTFPSPENGRALISIENGTKILDAFWVNTDKGETTASFKTTAEMAPNVYAHISLIQPYAQTINDRPMRMYGVIPIPVENPDSRLEPVIIAPEVLRPEQIAHISVEEKNGKAMTYTLAVVDEGLLSLTRYQTPNPWNHFYAREALGVKTWDMYDMVVGAFTEGMGSILSVGGDKEAVNPAEQKAVRFKPVVRFLGPYTLKAGKTAKHAIPIPNYIGAVRVMVVAGNNEAYGSADQEIPVRSPLMVLGTLPRVMGPGEEVSLPVNVFAMEEQIRDVSVSVSTNDLFAIVGSASKKIHFDKNGDKVVFFKLKTDRKTGIGKVNIEARSGSNVSKYEVEMDVRSANPTYTLVRDTAILKGESWNPDIAYFGLPGTNKATVELSKMHPLNLTKRLDFLIQYPHGCIEQITSGGFSQLFLSEMIDLSSAQKIAIERNIESILATYRGFQLSSGGLGYWPGALSANFWGTSYAGEFMLEAEKRGYALPIGLKSQWLRFQKAEARKWNSRQDRDEPYQERIQAYRLYTLARAGQTDFGSMNVLKGQQNLNISARWMLALAYIHSGQAEVAKKLIEDATVDIPKYTELAYSYGNSLRDKGFVLKTLHALNLQTDAARVANEIAQHLGSNHWYSTQTLAYCLGALAEYMGANRDDGLKATIIAGEKSKQYETAKNLIQHVLDPESATNNLKIQNNSEQTLYARLIISGQPLEGKEKRVASNLKMTTRYMDNNFNPISVKELKMGTDFIAEVTITNPGTRGYLREMALTQIFPSGWQILNPRMEAKDQNQNYKIDYQDIRDDRVLTYFDLGAGKSLTLRIRLNATYQGRFYMPAISCSAMYDLSIQAVEPGQWIEVVNE